MSTKRVSPASPPAIWTAFAAQGRWKNWVMVGQLLLLALMTRVCLHLARVEPDVVVVDDTGASHFVQRGAATEGLLRYLDTERKRPTDLTLLAYTERFIKLTAGVNSATIEESWSEALSMMTRPLAEKLDAEAKAQRLLETYRLAQVRTQVRFDDVQLVERKGDKAHVRATITRQRSPLFGPSENSRPPETQLIDLVLAEAPRSRRRPDGLEVLDWHTAPLTAGSDAGTQPLQPPGGTTP